MNEVGRGGWVVGNSAVVRQAPLGNSAKLAHLSVVGQAEKPQSVICHWSFGILLSGPVGNYLFINYEYPPTAGGSSTACQQIARAFANRGLHVVHLTTGFSQLQGQTACD